MTPHLTAVLWSPNLPWLAEVAIVILVAFLVSVGWSRAAGFVWATGWDSERLLVFTQAPVRFLLLIWVWSTLVGLAVPERWSDPAAWLERDTVMGTAEVYGAIVMTILVTFWGLRNLRDVVSGLVLSATRPFRLGDEIAVADAQGRVANVGLIRVRIATPVGELVDVPASSVTTRTVRIAPRHGGALPVSVEVGLNARQVEERAIEALRDHALLSIYSDASLPVTVEVTGPGQARVTATPTSPDDADALRSDIASRGASLLQFDQKAEESWHPGLRSPSAKAPSNDLLDL